MEVQYGLYVLDIDIQKTRSFYQKADPVTAGCSCSGCRNFEKSFKTLPDEIKRFFDALGIDGKKPAEVYTNTVNADGLVSYGGFYHLCGRLLRGESAWVAVSKDFHVSFVEDCDLVEDDFPEPVLQMEIEANIPWVLGEPIDI